MKSVTLLLTIFLFSSSALVGNCCKDLVALEDATGGEYSLFLKVRDPSRPGLQTIALIPQGYRYTYHHPWSGKEENYTVKHTFIGIATEGDTPPDIVKPGMALSEAGIAYGDADSPLIWVNPSRYAWDDFDWMRYACQEADTEDEAVALLTSSVIDDLHAPGVGENLFVVGSQKAFVIEGDAYHYAIKEITDVAAQSNYPKSLWRRSLYPFLIGPRFNSTCDKCVMEKQVVRLGGILLGIKITDITPDMIEVKQVPFGQRVGISLGDTKTVGQFRVTFLESMGERACISLSYHYYDWEQHILGLMEERYGHITLQDMIDWSRLHGSQLDGLRAMCEGGYEAATIYKIPAQYPQVMSSGWFAPVQCSFLYVPFHICISDIYEPYKTGAAHVLALDLLDLYGHDTLPPVLRGIENIFLNETQAIEAMAVTLLDEGKKETAANLLTTSDLGIQEQAYLWGTILRESRYIHHEKGIDLQDILANTWTHNYSTSLQNFKETMETIDGLQKPRDKHLNSIQDSLLSLAVSITECKVKEAGYISRTLHVGQVELGKARLLIEENQYCEGLDYLCDAYHLSDSALMKRNMDIEGDKEQLAGLTINLPSIALSLLILVLPILYYRKSR